MCLSVIVCLQFCINICNFCWPAKVLSFHSDFKGVKQLQSSSLKSRRRDTHRHTKFPRSHFSSSNRHIAMDQQIGKYVFLSKTKVDLALTVWPPSPSKVRKRNILYILCRSTKANFRGCYWTKSFFLAKRSIFASSFSLSYASQGLKGPSWTSAKLISGFRRT